MEVSMAIHGSTDSSLSTSSFTSSGTEFPLLHLPYTNYIEKRQLFLRSYRFSRKKTLTQRLNTSLIRFRRVIGLHLRSARRLRRVIWSRLRSTLSRRRRRFSRLVQHYHARTRSGCSDSCFW